MATIRLGIDGLNTKATVLEVSHDKRAYVLIGNDCRRVLCSKARLASYEQSCHMWSKDAKEIKESLLIAFAEKTITFDTDRIEVTHLI